MPTQEIEEELSNIELGLDVLGPDWADAIIKEATRRGYAIGDELLVAAAAQRLDDEDLLYWACEGGSWNINYWGEVNRRWTHEAACALFQREQLGGWLGEDAPPPPSFWWRQG
jgi:hypothetical protein